VLRPSTIQIQGTTAFKEGFVDERRGLASDKQGKQQSHHSHQRKGHPDLPHSSKNSNNTWQQDEEEETCHKKVVHYHKGGRKLPQRSHTLSQGPLTVIRRPKTVTRRPLDYPRRPQTIKKQSANMKRKDECMRGGRGVLIYTFG
jgi:hypothetical protein